MRIVYLVSALALVAACGAKTTGAVHDTAATSPRPAKAHAKPHATTREDQGWAESVSEPAEQETLTAHPTPSSKNTSLRGCFHLENDGDNFQGTDRAEPKTRPSDAPPDQIALDALLDQFKEGSLSDASMRSADHEPKMAKSCHFNRVEEKKRNVVVEGWVLASRKEDDNDFHLILLSLRDPGEPPDTWRLMNVEVSGLPPVDVPGRDQLANARHAFKDYFVPTVPDDVASEYTMLCCRAGLMMAIAAG